MIRQIKAITRAETAQLFFSPVAWLVIVLFSFQAYSNFTSNLLGIANDQDMYGMVPNISKELFSGMRGLFPSVLNYLYLYMPIVTMGLMSKEISSGSIKLLYSSPVTPFQIILGKFRSMAIFSAILTAVLLPGIIFAAFTVDNIDFGLIISGLCGVYLTLCTYSAIGLFMSALTGYQIVAALLTLGAFSFLEQLGSLGQNVEFLRPATYWASISGRADSLIEGLVSSEDVAYFILAIVLFLSFSVFLLQYRRDRNKWLCAAKYVGSTVIVLIVGVLTSNPWLTVYYDATRNDDNTITDTSRELIERLEGPLDITTYVNLSDYSAWLGAPSSINDDIKRYKQFMRFKPDINMEYVYFYDEPYANEDYGTEGTMPVLELAQKFAKGFGIPWRKVLTPEEIRTRVNLVPENNTVVKLLESGDGKQTFLRMFDDFTRIPEEQEISAAVRRLLEPPITLGVMTGHGERDVYSISDEGYAGFSTSKTGRDALVNHGFDIFTVGPGQQDSLSVFDILVVADPESELGRADMDYVFSHLDRGGNMLVAIEPGDEANVSALLEYMDVSVIPGEILCEDTDYAPELVPAVVSFYGPDLSYMFPPGYAVTMPGCTALDYVMSPEWEAVPLLLTPDGTRSLALALSRDVNGKEQRIVVLGDADCLGNMEMTVSRKNLSSINSFFCKGIFNWLSDARYPVDVRRPAPVDNNIALSPSDAEIVSLIFKWVLTALLIAAGCIIVIRRMRC